MSDLIQAKVNLVTGLKTRRKGRLRFHHLVIVFLLTMVANSVMEIQHEKKMFIVNQKIEKRKNEIAQIEKKHNQKYLGKVGVNFPYKLHLTDSFFSKLDNLLIKGVEFKFVSIKAQNEFLIAGFSRNRTQLRRLVAKSRQHKMVLVENGEVSSDWIKKESRFLNSYAVAIERQQKQLPKFSKKIKKWQRLITRVIMMQMIDDKIKTFSDRQRIARKIQQAVKGFAAIRAESFNAKRRLKKSMKTYKQFVESIAFLPNYFFIIKTANYNYNPDNDYFFRDIIFGKERW